MNSTTLRALTVCVWLCGIGPAARAADPPSEGVGALPKLDEEVRHVEEELLSQEPLIKQVQKSEGMRNKETLRGLKRVRLVVAEPYVSPELRSLKQHELLTGTRTALQRLAEGQLREAGLRVSTQETRPNKDLPTLRILSELDYQCEDALREPTELHCYRLQVSIRTWIELAQQVALKRAPYLTTLAPTWSTVAIYPVQPATPLEQEFVSAVRSELDHFITDYLFINNYLNSLMKKPK